MYCFSLYQTDSKMASGGRWKKHNRSNRLIIVLYERRIYLCKLTNTIITKTWVTEKIVSSVPKCHNAFNFRVKQYKKQSSGYAAWTSQKILHLHRHYCKNLRSRTEKNGHQTSNTKIIGVWSHNITEPMPANTIKIVQNSFLNTNPKHTQAWEDNANSVHEGETGFGIVRGE